MNSIKTTVHQVEAICHGTVIDHIPVGQGLKILKNLQLLESKTRITVGFNLPSKIMQLKDLIKIESRLFAKKEADKLAIFAPNATINLIQHYKIMQKDKMKLPDSIEGLFACPNLNCITHDEAIVSKFKLLQQKENTALTCIYCERRFLQNMLKMI
ncbi:MAG: aspartate carbamoyltransferase regulatory subunit [Endozoicomonadaceae bacterium]|nr:aspartate carbamoyltransferase regulatory subunit [Endozoicomonadaceae bacterium]